MAEQRLAVAAIWRYPVKAMLGEALPKVEVARAGCAGDRRWIVTDADSGERIANKAGPTDPRLRACRAELPRGPDGDLQVTLPNGDVMEADEVEPALSQLLERRVRLEAAQPGAGRFRQTGAHHDLAPIHLVTASALARLRELEPGCDWDVRRFRPNLLIDDGEAAGTDGPAAEELAEPFGEDELLGHRLRGPSGVELDIGLPTPRCVVPTRAQDDLPPYPGLLRALMERNPVDLGNAGTQGCVGAYAEVSQAGPIAVGDHLEVHASQRPAEQVVAATIARALS